MEQLQARSGEACAGLIPALRPGCASVCQRCSLQLQRSFDHIHKQADLISQAPTCSAASCVLVCQRWAAAMPGVGATNCPASAPLMDAAAASATTWGREEGRHAGA